MSGLMPSDSDALSNQEGELRTLWLDNEDAGDLLSSLASETARAILTELHKEPQAASELADSVGTSLQNVRHHLTNLDEAGLIRVADMRYSPKGREMNVYAPSQEPLVVFVGREEKKDGFVNSLKRLFAAVGVLAVASLFVQLLVQTTVVGVGSPGSLPRVPDSVGSSGSVLSFFDAVPPGALFFAGGALVLALVAGWLYLQEQATLKRERI